ncbi:uncharacterized protein LOC118483807 [Helianthus annuus]|uniref:uncharacterized protein LOC118483807 n=1 Tax=Helianthus annuus TaxID=4232 RepID=UPI0016531717|nr:uncharacterized protein LOC118483807 [Helianthus annuus]
MAVVMACPVVEVFVGGGGFRCWWVFWYSGVEVRRGGCEMVVVGSSVCVVVVGVVLAVEVGVMSCCGGVRPRSHQPNHRHSHPPVRPGSRRPPPSPLSSSPATTTISPNTPSSSIFLIRKESHEGICLR